MQGKNKNRVLFNAGGCCTAEALQEHLSGRLDPAQTVEIRSHLSSCPMCRDAAEGMEAYFRDKDMAAFNAVIGSISREVGNRSGIARENVSGTGKSQISFWIIFSGVMVVFVLTGWLTWRFSTTGRQPQGKQIVTKGPVALDQGDTVKKTPPVTETGKSTPYKPDNN
jgi:predicted anti-sigma-YlaC factor YlaD